MSSSHKVIPQNAFHQKLTATVCSPCYVCSMFRQLGAASEDYIQWVVWFICLENTDV